MDLHDLYVTFVYTYYKLNSWMLIYVDDIILIGECNIVIKKLIECFRATDLCDINNFLGMEIIKEGEKLKIKQTKLIRKILNK